MIMNRIYRVYGYVSPEGKWYIGQTVSNVNKRALKGKLYKGCFKEAIDKFGWESFEQHILRLCDTQEEADMYERLFIEKYNSLYPNGYNLQTGGKTGSMFVEDIRNKISKSVSDYHNNNPMSEEQRETISNRMKDFMLNQDNRQHLSNKLKGHKGYSKGKILINNGEINIYINPNLEIPEGFERGMIKRRSNK